MNGKKATGTILFSDGVLLSGTITINSASSDFLYFVNGIYNNKIIRVGFKGENGVFLIDRYGTAVEIAALKFEFGDRQTLAHQENGVWVLNEIPNYEEELVKCQTSTADSADTYANQKVSNITVQCTSVGSTSLTYYNSLIQSTHKVLDSTLSNPAAQTGNITVTTYDGYLTFSNNFASGETTNITLVLGTSGPVLTTTTTAPS